VFVVCSSVCRVHCNQSALPSYLSLSFFSSSCFDGSTHTLSRLPEMVPSSPPLPPEGTLSSSKAATAAASATRARGWSLEMSVGRPRVLHAHCACCPRGPRRRTRLRPRPRPQRAPAPRRSRSAEADICASTNTRSAPAAAPPPPSSPTFSSLSLTRERGHRTTPPTTPAAVSITSRTHLRPRAVGARRGSARPAPPPGDRNKKVQPPSRPPPPPHSKSPPRSPASRAAVGLPAARETSREKCPACSVRPMSHPPRRVSVCVVMCVCLSPFMCVCVCARGVLRRVKAATGRCFIPSPPSPWPTGPFNRAQGSR
jgi:hypothetical protein